MRFMRAARQLNFRLNLSWRFPYFIFFGGKSVSGMALSCYLKWCCDVWKSASLRETWEALGSGDPVGAKMFGSAREAVGGGTINRSDSRGFFDPVGKEHISTNVHIMAGRVKRAPGTTICAWVSELRSLEEPDLLNSVFFGGVGARILLFTAVHQR
jgi:hypothetical protein